jgi:hypothetical protein
LKVAVWLRRFVRLGQVLMGFVIAADLFADERLWLTIADMVLFVATAAAYEILSWMIATLQ